jgi:hypothetical protein
MAAATLMPVLTFGCALLATQGNPSAAFAQAAELQAAGATVAHTVEATAVVEAVDQQRREVLIRGTGGNLFALLADPAVNIQRLKAGDRILVRFVEALAVSLAKPGQDAGGSVAEQSGIGRSAPVGSSAAGTVENQMRMTVTIDAIDHFTHRVSFTDHGNTTHSVAVQDPAARRFVDTLKVGDRVDLVYTQSLAVAIDPLQQ